jgi:SulP family sulfate permease
VNLRPWCPGDQIFPEEDEQFSATLRAVRHASQLAGKHDAATFTDQRRADDGYAYDRDPAYYLV